MQSSRTLCSRAVVRNLSLTPRTPRVASAAYRAHRAVRHAAFSTSHASRAELPTALNLPKWLGENRHLLKPPVGNFCVWNDDMTVMIVGGPNARTDYHINDTPEYFYQYTGPMLLKTVQPSGQFHDILIPEGGMYLLPPGVPHCPTRFANTVGVVVEQPRPADAIDRLRWYCQSCGGKVHEASFHCVDLGSQIKDAVQAFEADTEARTCSSCGELCDVKPRVEPQPPAQ